MQEGWFVCNCLLQDRWTVITWRGGMVFSCTSYIFHQSFLCLLLHSLLCLQKIFFPWDKASMVPRESSKEHLCTFQMFSHCKILCNSVFQPDTSFSVCFGLIGSWIWFHIATKKQLTGQLVLILSRWPEMWILTSWNWWYLPGGHKTCRGRIRFGESLFR